MTTIRFRYRSKNDFGKLELRFFSEYEEQTTTVPITIAKSSWNAKTHRLKDQPNTSNLIVNQKLDKIKHDILNKYNEYFLLEQTLPSNWLTQSVADTLNLKDNRISNMLKKVYYLPFATDFMENKTKTWRNSNGKLMSSNSIKRYKAFLEQFEKVLKDLKVNLTLSNSDQNFTEDLISYYLDQDYSKTTINEKINYYRFFLNRAIENKLNVPEILAFTVPDDDNNNVVHPYLNAQQIELLRNIHTTTTKLQHIKDWFLIGLHTGLRGSDLLIKLSDNHIGDKYIKITPNKTKDSSGKEVVIPIHPIVKEVLQRYGGLPKARLQLNTFNKGVKQVVKLAGLDHITEGSKMVDGRQSFGSYPFYELVSSHIMRRSCATNLYGEVDNIYIIKMMGWSSVKTMLKYIKKSGEDYAKEIEKTWQV